MLTNFNNPATSQITQASTLNENKIAVNISKSLYAEIELRVKRSSGAFNSVDDYIEFVLDEFVRQDKRTAVDKAKPQENEEMKKRLRSLGYM
jgi:Arc/MetJ-type ribon-helix-helix transcriptional regulator